MSPSPEPSSTLAEEDRSPMSSSMELKSRPAIEGRPSPWIGSAKYRSSTLDFEKVWIGANIDLLFEAVSALSKMAKSNPTQKPNDLKIDESGVEPHGLRLDCERMESLSFSPPSITSP